MRGDDRLRLFVALRLPEATVAELVRWQQRELPPGVAVRRVPPENLHVTLAFLGSRPTTDMPGIVGAMRAATAQARTPIVLRPTGYRETRSVGMVAFDDEEARAAGLAETLWAGLEGIGAYEREKRGWLAHVTVVRFRERPRLAPPAPDLGAVSPSEVALYHSVLRREGARYEVLESADLGG